jgi:carbonic anhydrase/acetyltransferase-like protein (isoleucine patch superfamily)
MLEKFKDHFPKMGDGAFVHEAATVIGDVRIGKQSSIWPGVVLRGDMGAIVIGDETSIQDGTIAHITEGWSQTLIGNRVTVGHRVILHGCIVEDECLIGMGAILLDNCVIGKGSLVAAGTLVTVGMKIPAGSLVMGSPAKVIRQVSEKDRAMIESGWQTYVAYAKEYLATCKPR